ncbi:competence/damage-inducible protein A [Uliginosibacterium sp. H1]|uniref:competence/damage-inducible protein A n=1 Tax=Uliginosibacterium sp. H1 TaxID=3114757 RepID=UPI002E188179|nr:molybdopterin-binding protein [Uliginosibacterium sp. H1]
MDFGVLIIGDEILSGRRKDVHLARSIELLSARGLRLAWARYLGDDRDALSAVLRQTLAGEDVVFSFGGIGATPDDHTRQAAAAALGVPTVLHPEAAGLIEAQMQARWGRAATPQQLAMGEFPQGAGLIPNPVNRIPGFSLRDHHFVPGFPQMAHPMVEWVLDTHYAHLHHRDDRVEDALRVYEAPESALVDLMLALEQRHGVTVFSLPHLGSESTRRHIELGAKGPAEAVAAAMADMRAELQRRGHPVEDLPD